MENSTLCPDAFLIHQTASEGTPYRLSSQARSQKLKRRHPLPSLFFPTLPSHFLLFSLPFPPFPLEIGPLPLLQLGGLGSTQAPPLAASPSGARLPNVFGFFGLSKTHLVTTSLFLLCDCVTYSITGHTSLLMPQRSYSPASANTCYYEYFY